jgi:hypothetical protein
LRFGVGTDDIENLALAAVSDKVGERTLNRRTLAFYNGPDLNERPVPIASWIGVEAANWAAAKFCVNGHDWFSVSMQGFVLAEIGNGESERVDLDEVIADCVAEGKDKMGDVLGTLDLAAVER